MSLPVHTIVLGAKRGDDRYINQTSSSHLPHFPWRLDQHQKHPQLRLLLAISHPLRIAKSHSSLRRNRGYSSHVEAFDSFGGERFDVVRDLLVSGNRLRKIYHDFLHFDSYFFELPAYQVFGPASSRIQGVSDEYSWSHLCTKVVKTNVVFRRDWIHKFSAPNGTAGPLNGVPNLCSYGDSSVCQFVLNVSTA